MAAEMTQTAETDVPSDIFSETESTLTADTISLTPSSPSTSSTQYIACEESQQVLSGNDPMVLCMIRRKRASNVIVYRANTIQHTDNDGGNTLTTFHPTKPIDIFWLKLSARDLRLHRESGKVDDRVELTKVERMLAYGVHCHRIGQDGKKEKKMKKWSVSLQQKKNKIKARWSMRKNNHHNSTAAAASDTVVDQAALSPSPTPSVTPDPATPQDVEETKMDDAFETTEAAGVVDSFLVSFNALKAMHMTLRMGTSDSGNKAVPHLYGSLSIDGEDIACKLKEIWVTMKRVKNLKIDKVDYVTLCAIRCDNDEPIEYVMKDQK